MIRSGTTITNSVTGETIRFVTTASETDGEYVVIDVLVDPSGFVAAPHVHPFQTEVFEVLEGELTFRAGGKTFVADAGETVRVTPGMSHRFWNSGETRARFRCEIRPALQFERFITTMFALAEDGKTNRNGLPNLLRLAVIAAAHFDDVRLPFPPAWLQKAGLMAGARLGRLLGYAPIYEPSGSDEALVAF
jgi:quercetin dioxygenase-like cupin family protein